MTPEQTAARERELLERARHYLRAARWQDIQVRASTNELSADIARGYAKALRVAAAKAWALARYLRSL